MGDGWWGKQRRLTKHMVVALRVDDIRFNFPVGSFRSPITKKRFLGPGKERFLNERFRICLGECIEMCRVYKWYPRVWAHLNQICDLTYFNGETSFIPHQDLPPVSDHMYDVFFSSIEGSMTSLHPVGQWGSRWFWHPVSISTITSTSFDIFHDFRISFGDFSLSSGDI